jgi:hypothetical protein
MANTAPWSVDVTGTDDETYAFAVDFTLEDGTAFPFDTVELEYMLEGCGVTLSLTEASGITVTSAVVTFKSPDGALRAGIYDHACRIKTIASGEYTSVFDGRVTIGKGAF